MVPKERSAIPSGARNRGRPEREALYRDDRDPSLRWYEWAVVKAYEALLNALVGYRLGVSAEWKHEGPVATATMILLVYAG